MSENDKCWVCGKPNVSRIGGMRLCADHVGDEPSFRWKALSEEYERLQKVVADQALTIGTLKDEVGACRDSQRSDEERYKRAERVIDGLAFRMKLTPYEAAAQVGFGLDHAPETFKLREEAQTSRLALDVALKANEKLEGQLQSLWQAIDDAVAAGEDVRWGALERIEREAYKIRAGQLDENPKPGAAT